MRRRDDIRVLCEREPVGVHWTTCDAGICIELVATHATKRYVYQDGLLPPEQAEAQCHALGGSLVVLQSRDEREQLWLELTRLPVAPSRIWIGLAADAGTDAEAGSLSWVWDDAPSRERRTRTHLPGASASRPRLAERFCSTSTTPTCIPSTTRSRAPIP